MDEARRESLPSDSDTLKKYRDKRNFEITSEPKPSGEGGSPGQIFVIQKHSSRRLHYDLRLEVGCGVDNRPCISRRPR